MDSPKKISSARSVIEKVTIVAFLLLLTLPTIDTLFHVDHTRVTFENRAPASWPHLQDIGKVQDYVGALEAYFNDHFGFRKRLVRSNNHWKEQLFGSTATDEVVVGQDGWLYYAGQHFYEHYTGMLRMSDQEMERWRALLEQRQAWLAARGIKYLFVIPPDKHTIYPEYLPSWLQRGKGPSKVQQFVEYMKTHSTVPVLDLSKSLIDAKQIGINYRKTDTHWNRRGAFVAYRTLLEALTNQLPLPDVVSLDSYKWIAKPQTNGDLTRLMGQTEMVETTAFEAEPVKPVLTLQQLSDPKRFPYSGPEVTRPVYTFNAAGSHKALLFHDSFANAWYPFLGLNFREVIYIWHYDWDRPLIEREKPDLVIDEMLERMFGSEDPVALLKHDEESETRAVVTHSSSVDAQERTKPRH